MKQRAFTAPWAFQSKAAAQGSDEVSAGEFHWVS